MPFIYVPLINKDVFYLRHHDDVRSFREDQIDRGGEICGSDWAALLSHSTFCIFHRYLEVIISARLETPS